MKIILILLLALSNASCLLLGAAAIGTAVSAGSDRRSVGTITDDNILDMSLEAWAVEDEKLKNSHLNFNVYNGTVLITGEIDNAGVKPYIEQNIHLHGNNIRRVIDETIVAETSSIASRTKDSWIDSRIKLALNGQEVVNPSHINIHTEAGVVYLMGDVTQREANKAVAVVAEVGAENGVRKVVKHFNYLKNIPANEMRKAQQREAEVAQHKQTLEQQQEIERKKQELREKLRELDKQEMELDNWNN